MDARTGYLINSTLKRAVGQANIPYRLYKCMHKHETLCNLVMKFVKCIYIDMYNQAQTTDEIALTRSHNRTFKNVSWFLVIPQATSFCVILQLLTACKVNLSDKQSINLSLPQNRAQLHLQGGHDAGLHADSNNLHPTFDSHVFFAVFLLSYETYRLQRLVPSSHF